MFNNQVRQRVRGLVAGLGPSIVANPDQIEAKLADLASSSPDEVRAIVAAARGGVAEEIAAAPAEHRADMTEQASAWMASETGLPADLSRWAVESWEEALQGVQIAPSAPAPAAPASSLPVGAAQGAAPWPPPAGYSPAGAPAGGAPPAPWDTPRAPQPPQGAPWGAPPPPGGQWQGQPYGAPPTGAWPPSPQGYAGGQSWANNSGTEGPLPPQIAQLKWNWGAFGVSFWWLIFHGLWPLAVGWVALSAAVYFLPGGIPVHLGVIYAVQIALGLLGNKLAWQHRSYENIDHFFAVERVWMVWAVVLTIISTLWLVGELVILTSMRRMAGV